MTTTTTYRELGPSDELPDNWVNPYYLADTRQRIAVARVGSRLFAFDDMYESANGRCPLSAGLLDGTVIMSQCDGARFDLTTGAVVRGPATSPLRMYDVREVDGRIQVQL